MIELDIHEIRDGGRGRYFVSHGEKGESELTYTLRDSTMVIDYTYTPPVMRGEGVAGRLVERAVEDARERGWTIRPVCPYVKIKIDRTPAWHDVLEA
ncbi:N-acetyltransferase [Marinicauda algicola]|uniref:N-acetyltransferase n=1 Tax=Marinicauda algicola TaxID=2029849 RepID=A0A4S2H2B4_9PROT|nr:GNAT family N-acetyltransferase [Marinicauda algicola]TGY89740.1 N-acetyltransferase [Marinicauda algicola]